MKAYYYVDDYLNGNNANTTNYRFCSFIRKTLTFVIFVIS